MTDPYISNVFYEDTRLEDMLMLCRDMILNCESSVIQDYEFFAAFDIKNKLCPDNDSMMMYGFKMTFVPGMIEGDIYFAKPEQFESLLNAV